MNDRQRIVLAVTAGVLVLLFLFPPFAGAPRSGTKAGYGHSFIFDPPKARYGHASVDAPALLAEAFVACAIGGIAWFAFKGWEPKKDKETDS